MSAGAQYIYGEDPVEINVGRKRTTIRVSNTGDRAIQVGSHYHFFEANRALDFDRAAAYGMHLDIASGTAVRFEPGDTREVTLCAYGGNGRMVGFSNLVNGGLNSADTQIASMRRAKALNFKGAKDIDDRHGAFDAESEDG